PADPRVLSPESGSDANDTDASDAGPGAYYAAVLDDRPVAYFPLDESSGTVVYDPSGNQHNRVATGIEWNAPGAIVGMRTGAKFSGTARIAFGDVFDYPGAQFTVEVWVKATFLDTTQRRIFSKETSGAARTGYLAWVASENPGFGAETYSG